MSEVKVTDVELGSIGISREVQLKLRARTLSQMPTYLEVSNWSKAFGYHNACPFPDEPQAIKALIGALQERLETAHGEA
ncbi:hypothetical protein ACWET9_48810 [Streptomyces sp. NPDC004059]